MERCLGTCRHFALYGPCRPSPDPSIGCHTWLWSHVLGTVALLPFPSVHVYLRAYLAVPERTLNETSVAELALAHGQLITDSEYNKHILQPQYIRQLAIQKQQSFFRHACPYEPLSFSFTATETELYSMS